MNVRATAKFVGTSSRKVGLAAALIRGQKATEAVTVLRHTPQRATEPVGKVLASAIANAENNYNLRATNLVVESVLVGPGRTLKRFRPRAQGRAYPVRKRSSHITVVLRDEAPSRAATHIQSAAAVQSATVSNPPATKADGAVTKPAKRQAATGETKEAN